ncbi:Protein of avirulence locus ImpE [hydrothermal vent metagenome]|uniref:Protein of avirulence locus ImpE n=1 Tax=hydrothermal vent metagenome TaxID=652676 RepID=A0A3B0VZ10_9ZZZZ
MTLSAKDCYLEGNLTAAISAISEEISNEPNNANKRAFLVELLCFNGDFDRADKQLNALVILDPSVALSVGTWRQLIRAAQTRYDVYESGAIPEVIEAPTPRIQDSLALLLALRENRTDDCAKLISKIDSKPNHEYSINNQLVNGLRDLDDINAGIFEVMASNGKYFWVDFSQVIELHFSPPERPLDLLWRKATISLINGTEGEVFIPSIYHGSKNDDAMKLGKKTDWVEHNSVINGQGLRTWLVGDEDLSIMDITSIINIQPAVTE